jgi:hypothetical protein
VPGEGARPDDAVALLLTGQRLGAGGVDEQQRGVPATTACEPGQEGAQPRPGGGLVHEQRPDRLRAAEQAQQEDGVVKAVHERPVERVGHHAQVPAQDRALAVRVQRPDAWSRRGRAADESGLPGARYAADDYEQGSRGGA